MGDITKMFPARDPDDILKCGEGRFEKVITVGVTQEGGIYLNASDNLSRAEIVLLLEQAKTFTIGM